MKYIDDFLNKITMYKLVLWGLFVLAGLAITFGFVGLLPYSGISLVISLSAILFICFIANNILAMMFKVQTNTESWYISSLILFFILFPITTFADLESFITVGLLAMASKYLLVINKKHIFNPVAVSVFVAGLLGSGISAWWVGSEAMIIPVVILGFLILRKTQRFQMFFAYLVATVFSITLVALYHGSNLSQTLTLAFLSGPIIFLGTIMLTEPQTTPPQKKFRIIYGIIVGLLFGAQFHFGKLYTTPELALIIGNIFVYFVSPKIRLVLTLAEKKKLSTDIYNFIWRADEKFTFKPGQYLEWTLGHSKVDARGNRRFFTIASSPTEENVILGTKFYQGSSSFKQKLISLTPGDKIIASQLAGSFVLPEDKNKKLVFLAGGIGVTPFRSMIKNLIDTGDKRVVTLFFSNRTPFDIVYKDIFDLAEQKIGLKTFYVIGDLSGVAPTPSTRVGYISGDMITKEVPDYKERIFYISGPRVMVTAFEDTLSKMGIKKSQIKTDFFPGFV